MAERSRLASMKNRVVDFEIKTDERIRALLSYEKEISDTALDRKRWLSHVSSSVDFDSKIYRHKVANMKAAGELLNLRLSIDSAITEQFYESQTLHYLISATKPYEEGESEEIRQKLLSSGMSRSADDVKGMLNKSLAVSSSFTNDIDNLIQEVMRLKFQHDQQTTRAVFDLQIKVRQYMLQLQESLLMAKSNDKMVTGDYLMLRHNSRVATSILVRSQNEANLARLNLQKDSDFAAAEVAAVRDKLDESSSMELKTVTDEIRQKLSSQENLLDSLLASRRVRIRAQKKKICDLSATCDMYDGKYDALQNQRKYDLERVGGELKRLREMVGDVEVKLLNLSLVETSLVDAELTDGGRKDLSIMNNRLVSGNDQLRLLKRA